jgi:hypothetical protein
VAFALFALWSLQAASAPSPAPPSRPAQVQPSPSRPAPSPDGEGALIRNSGSTNTQPYTISVSPDGSAVLTVGSGAPEARRLPPGQAEALFHALRAATPLDALAGGHCMRSVSFGTSTTVTFGGAITPDLSCAPAPAARDLAGAVDAIVAGLQIPVMRVYRSLPPPQ